MPYDKTEMVNGQNMGSRAVAIQAQNGDCQVVPRLPMRLQRPCSRGLTAGVK